MERVQAESAVIFPHWLFCFQWRHDMTISLSLGLLILRLVVGLTIAAHGAQKLFGWFGGPGFTKTAQGMQKQGFNPTWFWTSLVILGEFGGGLSVAFGFLTPLGAAGIF